MNFYMAPGDWVTFGVTITSGGCTETIQYTFQAIQGPYSYYRMAPNPVNADLTIYLDEEKLKNQRLKSSSDQSIRKVIIMDRLGRLVAQQNYPVNTKRATIDVRRLFPDMYIARIYDGKNWTVMKFLKK